MRLLLLIGVFYFALFQLQAQTTADKKFSENNPKEFLKQLEKEMKQTQMEALLKTHDDLLRLYEKDKVYADAEINLMATTCNELLKAKMRLNPHLDNYLQFMVEAKVAHLPPDQIATFHELLKEVVNNQKLGLVKDYQTYMEFSFNYFLAHILKNTGAKLWRVIGEGALVYDNEPKLNFTSAVFVTQAAGDTSYIKNTSGTWLVFGEKWLGNAGKMDWTRAGMDSDQVYCTFSKYVVDVKKADLIIDSVKFFNKQFLSVPIYGRLTDKVISKASGVLNANYPKFDCNKKFDFTEFTPGAKFSGGFAQHGFRIIGTGFGQERAELKFYDSKKKLVAVIKSTQFIIKKGDELSASNAEIKLLIKADSIYHPGAEFKFKIPTRILRISRGETGVSKIAFTDSYHKTDIKTEAIYWMIDSPKIVFNMITGAGKIASTFESQNYFEPQSLEKYTNISDFNPLSVLKRYCESHKVTEMDADDLAKAMNPKYDESIIKRTLYNLMEDGFIYYDESKHWVTMKDKTVIYIKANRKLIDYDNIQLKSTNASGANAEMNLTNNEIGINGVKSVNLSDSNGVYFYPSGKSLVMKQNRDMVFGGVMIGGRLDLIAKKFDFNYKSYKVNIENGDSMLINIPTGKMADATHEELRPIKTYISRISGEFAIDAPMNKSGRIRLKQYPSIKTNKPAYTFYEGPHIHNYAYKKNVFYFQLDTFQIDSLNSFDVKGLKFPGLFVSGNILPDIRQTLFLQRDLSLGFKATTPEEGLMLYGGKGKYYGEYDLSNDGLYGDGIVEFLSSKSTAKRILFMPDSLNAHADKFDQVASTNPVEFPEVHNTSVAVHWEPKQDKMFANMDTSNFKVFGGIAALKGNVTITSKGMYGNGLLDWKEANSFSLKHKFSRMGVKADSSDLVIRTLDQVGTSFMAKNIRSAIDFEKRIGDFISNDPNELASNFVYNQFSSNMDQFHWDMNAQLVDFKSSRPSDTTFMISQNSSQTGLKFQAKTAKYYLGTTILKVEGVPFINSGDCRIMPDSGRVYIEPKAVIRTLKNAKILSDTINQFHKIYDATVSIASRNQFVATNAKYDFNSKVTGKQILQVDSIYMKEIGANWHSYGFANIKEDQNFSLNKKMTFKGYFKFIATKKDPELEGFARLKLNTSTIRTDWFSLNSVIRADSGNFNVYNPKNEKGDALYFGIMRGIYDSIGVYPSIFAAAANPNDQIVFRPEGFLQYNPNSNEIVYGNTAKLNGITKRGDFLKFNDATNKLYCEGKFNFGLNYAPIKVATVGNCYVDLNKNAMVYNLCVGLKIDVAKELMDLMIKDWIDLTADKQEADYKSPWIGNALAELISDRELKKAMKTIDEEAEVQKLELPKDLPYNIFLTNVRMAYDPFANSFKAVGNVSLVNLGGQYFGKQVYAYIEFGMKKGGDYFNILFETSEADWYFFNYTNHVLQTLSSNDTYTSFIQTITPEKRTIKDATNPVIYYIYQQAPEVKKRQFKERMRSFRY